MPSVQRFNGNLIIQTPFATGVASNITLDSDQVIITGNLTVQGNTTAVSSNNLTVTDNVIILNKGETGAGVTRGNAGILIDRGSFIGAQIQWAENLYTWQISGNTGIFSNILTSSSGNVGLTSLFDDKNPRLGANLNTQNFSITSANNNIVIGANLQLNNNLANVPVVTNASIVFAQNIGLGRSGVYVVNSTTGGNTSAEELSTLKSSLLLGLLLG